MRPALLGALLLVLALMVWWPADPNAPMTPAPPAQIAQPTQIDVDEPQLGVEPPDTALALNLSASTETVTPPGKPAENFATSLPALEARAAAGDQAAGWQLYSGLMRCRLPLLVEHLSEQAKLGTSQLAKNSNNRLAKLHDARASQDCRGLSESQMQRAFDVLLRLALQGDLKAQLQFSLDPPLHRNQALAELPRIFAYRQHAPALLERALQQGSLQALFALLEAHSPSHRKRTIRMSMLMTSPSSPRADNPVDYRARISASRSAQEYPHEQILTADPHMAYRYALVCKRLCTHATWLARADLVINESEAIFDAPTRLRIGGEAQDLILGPLSRPATGFPINWGYQWNAQ